MNYIFSLALLEQLQVLLSQPWMSCIVTWSQTEVCGSNSNDSRSRQRCPTHVWSRPECFPPPVAEATDSRDSPGRVHTSILGPPNKARTVLNQPMASLLQRVGELQQAFPDMSNDLVDPYHTLVAYFNSLRELGGAQASLPGRIAAELIPRFADESGYQPRELMERKELTSRRTSSELKRSSQH